MHHHEAKSSPPVSNIKGKNWPSAPVKERSTIRTLAVNSGLCSNRTGQWTRNSIYQKATRTDKLKLDASPLSAQPSTKIVMFIGKCAGDFYYEYHRMALSLPSYRHCLRLPHVFHPKLLSAKGDLVRPPPLQPYKFRLRYFGKTTSHVLLLTLRLYIAALNVCRHFKNVIPRFLYLIWLQPCQS